MKIKRIENILIAPVASGL